MQQQNTSRHPEYGVLAERYGYGRYLLQVLSSRAGYYIGTQDARGLPVSRESKEYYSREDEAKEALREGTWTQRAHP